VMPAFSRRLGSGSYRRRAVFFSRGEMRHTARIGVAFMQALSLCMCVTVFSDAGADERQNNQAKTVEVNCDIQREACTAWHGTFEAVLDISPRPVRTMQKLQFLVTPNTEVSSEDLMLELAMPGMFMGKNTVVLKKALDGRYVGTGIVPRCASGRTLWSATVDFPGKGTVRFLFHVVH